MKSILIVDDDPDMRQVIEDALADNYTFASVANGIEALKKVDEQSFDLVITDLLMPEMDGIELVMALRKSEPRLKLIAMSGGGKLASFDCLRAAQKLGASSVLRKPFGLDELRMSVQQLLNECG